jgi:hypothetical protein
MHMSPEVPLTVGQIVVQVCLFLVAAIAIFGGSLQMYLGQPDTAPRLDNVHRFMAGVYLSTGIICLWAAFTIRQQGALVYLLALGNRAVSLYQAMMAIATSNVASPSSISEPEAQR